MRRRAWLTGASAVLLAGRRSVASGQAAKRPLVAAHRGGALLWAENSMTAHRSALALGVDFLETDIHLTADDEAVVLHDATLDRTTTGRGPVSALKLADLRDLRLKAADGTVTADGIPTLGALLDLLVGQRAELLLEIKVGADRQRYPGIEEKALEAVKRRQLFDRTLVMGFQADTIRRVRELEPRMRTVWLVSRTQLERQGMSATDAVRRAADAGAVVLGIQHTALDAAGLDAARKANVRVAAWTVNEEAHVRRVIDLGVDVVISDRPDLALRLAGR
ncbi:MAG: hypothetical protein HYU41_23110 [Candidatus Rokubacteria bacterium]|nr:hypothetical protein [Candidatus Rokubacteria bacterium]